MIFSKGWTSIYRQENPTPEFDLFSDLEEYSEEEVPGTMTETMEECMCKTRCDYGSGVTRPKIDAKNHFELKGQFLKELRDNTFIGSDHEDANEHNEKVLEIEDLKAKFLSKYYPPAQTAKKMEEINNFQQEPDETLYRAWERFKELLMKCPQYYLTDMKEVILFYNGVEVPTRQILDSKGVIPTKTAADVKIAIQEMAEYSQKWHNETSRTRSTETSDGLAAIQAQLNNLGREIKKVNEKVYAAQVGSLVDLGASASVMPLSTYLNLGLGELAHTKLTVELADRTVKHPRGIAKNVLVGIGKFVFPVDFIILEMPEDINVPFDPRNTIFVYHPR
ncbi:reverse transcriptase domain-containing protein [Tanacetum coccineum]|uniref:Reverse transcriptase domain-containing protein n=1 Tax=Tanacetum coccineum TaxID=301880 RepID=A0ABQ5ETB4_9ASTR